jgi:acyl carrier protein
MNVAEPTVSAEELIKLVCEQLGFEASDIKPTTHFVNDLGADSLDIVEMGLCLEERFGIKIPEQDYPHLATLENAAAYLSTRLSSS